MNEKKVRQHKLTDKNPYISSILLLLVGFFIFSVLLGVINLIIAIPFPNYPIDYGPVGMLVGIACGLLFYKSWFKGEFTGFFRYGKFGPGVPLVAAYLIYLAISIGYDFINGNIAFHIDGSRIITALFAGVIEEYLFRGYMTSTLMRRRKNKNSIMIELLFPAIVFGFVHLTNVFSGAGFLVSLFQSLGAIAAGMAFGAMYIMTGNLAIPMAIHFLHDVIALCLSDSVNSSGVMTGSIGIGTIIELILSIALFVYVFCYAKKQKNIDIAREIWDKKWIIPETSNEV